MTDSQPLLGGSSVSGQPHRGSEEVIRTHELSPRGLSTPQHTGDGPRRGYLS